MKKAKSKATNKPRPRKKSPPISHPWKRTYRAPRDPITGKPLKVMEVTEVDGDWQD